MNEPKWHDDEVCHIGAETLLGCGSSARHSARISFTPESTWQAWRAWDSRQKREPSAWLTLIAWRMLRRTL